MYEISRVRGFCTTVIYEFFVVKNFLFCAKRQKFFTQKLLTSIFTNEINANCGVAVFPLKYGFIIVQEMLSMNIITGCIVLKNSRNITL